METTLTLSANLNTTPFKVFEQDCDGVIMLINYFINKADNKKTKPFNDKDEEYIFVNDATATGGWW